MTPGMGREGQERRAVVDSWSELRRRGLLLSPAEASVPLPPLRLPASAEAANWSFTRAGTPRPVSAQLNKPLGVSATADGGFLIADEDNHRIRKVAADETITTVAGRGCR
jgi:hypothetical protein